MQVDAEVARTQRRIPTTGDDAVSEPWLVEALAQTAAVLNGNHERSSGERSVKGMLVGVRRFVIHRLPRPGETLVFVARLRKRLAPLTLIEGEVLAAGLTIARGELKFYVEATA